MIKLQGITKSFPDGKEKRTVLDGIDIDIEKGTLTAIMGRSGCGKTTLLYIMAGLMKPDSGSYLWNGKELQTANRKEMQQLRLKHIGFVLQEDTLLYDRNVRQNILLGAKFLRIKKQDALIEMEQLTKQLNIGNLLNAQPSVLSGGEKQRTAIARSLLGGKEVLLADEPTGALDRDNAVTVMECFRKMRDEGKTIIVVTHDEAVASMCDRTIHIEYGKIADV